MALDNDHTNVDVGEWLSDEQEIEELRKLVRFFAGGLMAMIVRDMSKAEIEDYEGVEIWKETLAAAEADGVQTVFNEYDDLSHDVFKRAIRGD